MSKDGINSLNLRENIGHKHTASREAAGSNAEGSPERVSLAGASELQQKEIKEECKENHYKLALFP